MFKKIGIPALALFALMVSVSAPQANAAVRFGISIGGPVYRAPAPVYSYYAAAPAYSYGYVAPAPVYSYPYGYYGGGYGYRDHVRVYEHGREFRDRDDRHFRR